MACKTSYELHHQFPRLAEESGFTFNTHRPRVHIDWNKIRLIDLDSLIRDRKFVLIEQHMNDILDCVFESEFDVRILDEGVMKMFRLAQLAVEYQQFCRHYLDRSVFVLREEITSLAQELDSTKKQLHDKEDELRKLRKRSRHTFKAPLPYGNDNIAAMILKSLSNKGDVFPTTSNTDALQHNKCNYCDKVFMNQLYLQSHIARRHAEIIETPQKDKNMNESNNDNVKLSAEIMELKAKLKEMEVIIANATNKVDNKPLTTEHNPSNISQPPPSNISPVREKVSETKYMKDAEVSTNNEEYLLSKIEEWKKQDHEKYNKEISALRTQIIETIHSIKEQQEASKDSNVIEQLHYTILQQGAEITALRHELNNSKFCKENESANTKETEAQILFWTKRAETQAKQYDALLQKLNEVAKDAKESRDLAASERERASQLQNLLQSSLNKKSLTTETSTDDLIPSNIVNKEIKKGTDNTALILKTVKKVNHPNKNKQMADRHTLEHLHRKAQELLNVASISSSSTESSSPVPELKLKSPQKDKKVDIVLNRPHKKDLKNENISKGNKVVANKNSKINKVAKTKEVEDRNEKTKPEMKKSKEAPRIMSGSPMRVVRAKITEEVNNRIVSFGVDPLKSRLQQNVFQKQKSELQKLHEIKSKKNSMYEKVKYNIITNLDSCTEVNTMNDRNYEYSSPNKLTKPLRSFSSVISNVKSKAMSLVKLTENSYKDKKRSINGDVTRKAMSLQTPPGSTHESPINHTAEKQEENNVYRSKNNEQIKAQIENNSKYIVPNMKIRKEMSSTIISDDSEESNSEEHNFNIPNSENKSIENLIKSPARRPLSADRNTKPFSQKYNVENGDMFTRSQSAIDLVETKVEMLNIPKMAKAHNDNSSDDIDSLSESPLPNKKQQFNKNDQNVKQTKSVLKHASSTSSLNKKKVLFDMDAIQMKSVSASPSQSITEKSDNGNEQFELGLVNLEGDEWDISSIENEPLKNDTKIQVNTRASPKIAELKHVIESQLARRSDITSTAIVGGVDILSGPVKKPASIGGSNTSLGSSILDDSEGSAVNHKTFVKPKKVTEKEDSELDISEFSMDGITNSNKIKNDF